MSKKSKKIDDTAEQARIAERSDASQLIGMVTCKDKHGNIIPMLDKDGNEILAIATGEKYGKK